MFYQIVYKYFDTSVIEINIQNSIFFAFIISPHTLNFFMEENFVDLSNELLFFESCCLITAYAFKLNNARYCIQDKVNNHINSDLNVKLSFQITHMTLKMYLYVHFEGIKCVKRPIAYFGTSD